MGLPTIYRSSDVGAPTLDCNKGSLITVLKACLVNGITSRSCTITRTGNVATVTLNGHGFASFSNVTISGANQSEYNVQTAITVVDANTFTYTVAGTPVTPATGTIIAGLPGAGWTIALEDAGAFKIIFRNDTVSGSGRYFRVQDNGITNSDPTIASYFRDGSRSCVAAICGMSTYTDIDTPVKPFPRVMAGGDLVHNYAYGITIRKGLNITTPSSTRPWMIIADSRVCHIFTTSAVGTTAMTTSVGTPYEDNIRGVTSFGDVRQINPSNTITAKAYIMGGYVGSLDVQESGNNAGTQRNSNYVVPTQNTYVYLDTSLENSAHTVRGYVKAEYEGDSTFYGGNCLILYGFAEGSYEHYPSPATYGFTAEKLFMYEDLEDPIRTNISAQNKYRYLFGWIPGFYVSPHTTNTNTSYRVGDELSKVSDSGKDYLIYSLMMHETATIGQDTLYARLFATETTDWWL